MKIAITGGTAGIGQALGDIYEAQGHEVLRLSRRTGHNIRSTPKIAEVIEPCDLFINNAQAGFAQTELLFEIWRRWQNTNKTIMVISTMMTQCPVSVIPDMDEYFLQKKTLEDACAQLRYKEGSPAIILVKPGAVATQPGQQVGYPYCDPVEWAQTLVDTLDVKNTKLRINEIAIGARRGQ